MQVILRVFEQVQRPGMFLLMGTVSNSICLMSNVSGLQTATAVAGRYCSVRLSWNERDDIHVCSQGLAAGCTHSPADER
jgi:hypothetical protein